MNELKQKKDEYQKILAAFGQAMKHFHKGDLDKAADELKAFMGKYPAERELVDRAQIYLSISEKRPRKESVHLKNFEDYCNYAVFKINAGDHEGALKLLEKALEFKTEEEKVHYLLADVLCLMGKTDEGLDYLRKAIQKDKIFAVMAQNEADFSPLREDKKFKLITRLA